MTNNAARKLNASTTTRGVKSWHLIKSIPSSPSWTSWSVAFAVLSCKVPAHSTSLVVASHGVRDYGSNKTMSPFSSLSKVEQFFRLLLCSMQAWRKRRELEWVLPPESVRKFSYLLSIIFLKPGLSWTGQSSQCSVALIPGDWEDATRLDLVMSFLISMLRLVRNDSTQISVTYKLYARIRIVKESRLSLFFVFGHEVGEKEVKKVDGVNGCFVWEDVPFWNRLFTTSTAFDFSTFCESFQEGRKYALGQSERSSLTSQLIFIHQMPFPIFCREKAYARLCFRAKKTVTFYFQSQWNIVTVSKGKKAMQANDRQLEESSSCSDRDSEVTVLVPQQTEVLMLVWGSPSKLGTPLLSTNQRTVIYTGLQALFLAIQYGTEPGGAGFEATTQCKLQIVSQVS